MMLKKENTTDTTGNKLLSRRTAKAFLIALILIIGPSYIVDHIRVKSIENAESLFMEMITRNITEIDSMEEWENMNNLYHVSFSLEDALKSYKKSLEQTEKYFIILKVILFSAIILLIAMLHFNHHILVDESVLKDNSTALSIDLMEKERNILALDIHDDVAQKLSIIGRTLEEESSKGNKETLLSAKYARDLLDTVRGYSTSLRTPENLYDNLDASLGKLCTDFSIYSHIDLHCRKMGLKALSMTPDNSRHLYRIIQESLNNAHKHSHANSVHIFILYSHPKLTVKIKDNGQGFDLNNLPENGLGLDGIKYRLKLLGARYEMKSEIGKGTEFKFELQIKNEKNINS